MKNMTPEFLDILHKVAFWTETACIAWILFSANKTRFSSKGLGSWLNFRSETASIGKEKITPTHVPACLAPGREAGGGVRCNLR